VPPRGVVPRSERWDVVTPAHGAFVVDELGLWRVPLVIAGSHATAAFLHADNAVDEAAEEAAPAVAAREVAAAALRAAGTRRAVFSRADVAGQVAAHLPTSGLSAVEVVERVEQLTDLALSLEDAVAVTAVSRGMTARASDGRYATVQVLTVEAPSDVRGYGAKSFRELAWLGLRRRAGRDTTPGRRTARAHRRGRSGAP
jgi:hypothetical protein